MSEETPESSLEAARLEKLHRIAGLGLDPWGQRFDDHQAIGVVREIALPEVKEGEEVDRPKVRIAGRIVLKRGQGKVAFLQVRDWTGTLQVMIGKNQVGEAAWALASELDRSHPCAQRPVGVPQDFTEVIGAGLGGDRGHAMAVAA